jgi:dephospho-CoA kinase
MQSRPVVAVESAILFESGFYTYVDKIITVTAPVELRIARAMGRSKLSREEVMRRMENQLPDERKIEQSDAVIDNDGIKAILPQMEKIFVSLCPKN